MPVRKSALAIELAAESQGHDPIRHRFKLAQVVGVARPQEHIALYPRLSTVSCALRPSCA
jgi:hypothetical protein